MEELRNPFRCFRCSVSVRGQDEQVHTAEFEAAGLFHAAEQGILQWCLYSWFLEDQPIEVRSGKNSWRVDQKQVRKWRTRRAGS
jgi:hypothetical protein